MHVHQPTNQPMHVQQPLNGNGRIEDINHGPKIKVDPDLTIRDNHGSI
jgi:hypothetical protein